VNTIQAKLIERFPALASRDFVIFVSGQFISVIGTWAQATALPYLAYRVSGRPFDLGLIGFANTLPTLLFALPAGVLVERWDKRRAVIILQAIMALQAFGLAWLAYTDRLQIWHIIGLSFLSGLAVSIEVTARQSMLIELAGREALPSAIALQTTAFNSGRVLGPILAAWLIAASGTEGSVFLANGISFLFVIGSLFVARTRFKVQKEAEQKSGLAGEFWAGIAFIKESPLILAVILMAALVGFFGIPLTQQIPAVARDVLKSALDTEAIIASRTSQLYAAQGVGALTAAFLAAYLASADRQKMLMAGQAAFIFPIIALGFVRELNTALVLLALVGWGTVTQLVTMNTLIQVEVPDHLRGRVFSVYFWALQGVAPFGSLVIGWIAQTWNVPVTILVGGMTCLVGIAAIRLTLQKAAAQAKVVN
jgi:MFS family permease